MAPQTQQPPPGMAQPNGPRFAILNKWSCSAKCTYASFPRAMGAMYQSSMGQSDQFTLQVGNTCLMRCSAGPRSLWAMHTMVRSRLKPSLALLVAKSTDQRVHLPAQNPVVLDRNMSSQLRFESHMTEAHHKRLNEFLKSGRASVCSDTGSTDWTTNIVTRLIRLHN